MSDWLTDVRVVLRGWRRAPGFSATIILTLVLGIGLASAIFTFADGYLFRPLPFPGADRLYHVLNPNNKLQGMISSADHAALRSSPVADLGLVQWSISDRPVWGQLDLRTRRVPVMAYGVSAGFRRTVQLPLIAGRDFSDADHRNAEPVPAWLTYRYWEREFGRDRDVVGRSYSVLTIRGTVTTIEVVGILGPEATSFDLNNEPPDIVVPDLEPARVGPMLLAMPIVRLPDGQSREQAEGRIASVLQSTAPAPDGTPRVVRLRSLHEYQVSGGRPTARVLFAGALLVLLLATINLVHLLLTRGVARAGEIATRAALGAGRWRLTRLFLTESLLLAIVGAAGGLLAGAWLSSVIEASIPRLPTGGRNMALVPMLYGWRTAMFACALGLIIALAGGLWPARRAFRRSLAWTNRSAGLGGSMPARLSRAILASELAVATIVLVGTIFIGLGIWRYLNRPLGFDYDERFSVSVTRAGGQATTVPEVEATIAAIRNVSGVRAATAEYMFSVRGIEIPGVAIDPRTVTASAATESYFETWNLRLRRGRWFAAEEFAGRQPVAVINETLARMAWPGADPLGQEIRVNGVLNRVVGVIEPMRRRLAMEPPGQVIVPAERPREWTSAAVWAPGISAEDLQRRVEGPIGGVVPGAEILVRPMTLQRLFSRDIGEALFQAPIMLAFGVLAFILAGVGVFGLVSYLVAQRTREFGIRFALGARPGDVWQSVIRQSLVPAIAGFVIGVGSAWALESVVRSSVFGWQSSGAGAIAAVAIALLGVTVFAAAWPARRAMRIDPAITLRAE
jgi:predicted permease